MKPPGVSNLLLTNCAVVERLRRQILYEQAAFLLPHLEEFEKIGKPLLRDDVNIGQSLRIKLVLKGLMLARQISERDLLINSILRGSADSWMPVRLLDSIARLRGYVIGLNAEDQDKIRACLDRLSKHLHPDVSREANDAITYTPWLN